MEILGSIWWLAVALGLLVTFHEFGHYWVARRCGVRVLRFSVGFGRALWRRRGKNGVEFVIGAIPLGGYVKMLDEREAPVPENELDQAFNRQSLGRRTAIVAAGPVFNLIFAVAAFWLMFMIGIPESRPLLGEPSGMAEQAGLERGDLIVAVGDSQVETWTHAVLQLIPRALDRRPVTLRVEDAQGRRRELTLPLDQLGPDFDEARALEQIGLQPWRPDLEPLVGSVSEGSPAERAGLREGDRIVSINGQQVTGWQDIAALIPSAAADQPTIQLGILREDRNRKISVTPEKSDGRLVIGIRPPEPDDATRRMAERGFTVLQFGPVAGLGEAFEETWKLTSGTLGMLGRMVTGKASLSNLSGPITIAQMANSSAGLGVSRFLFFLGLISLSLAIINLLPIPVLDGGHLLYFGIEAVKGSPLSERGQMIGQAIGMAMILALMTIAIFNDILRLFQ
ncbi:MAG: RIP metalloprotease RseP [Wenzhouxiangellaceae bacterium]|nr:RIP metalloprotease RseP [Wenzhouxiangellaceae bacterium]